MLRRSKSTGDPETAPVPPKPELKDEIVETEHSVAINGQAIAYTAMAGADHFTKDEEGKPKATIFFIAYTRKNVEVPSRRPLTIPSNGGPGPPPFGCTWVCWALACSSPAMSTASRRRPTGWRTTTSRCWT